MITLATSGPTNDLLVQNGQLVIYSDTDQISQSIRETLGLFYGEWFLNNQIGVPWLQQIFVDHPNLDVIQAILLSAVQDVPGVAVINSFEFDFNNASRALSVTMTIQTTNGQTLNLEQTVSI